MERNPTPLTDGTTPPDDAELGALVRAVAEDWHRPPQRLDQPTWRERVEVGRRGSRSSGGRRWFGKVAEAGVLAVVATLVLAVSAIFLVGDGRDGGVGTVPSTNPTEGATGSPDPNATTHPSGTAPAPAASPLPALLVNGDLPSVTNVLMAGNGYRLIDLSTGTPQASLPWERGGWNAPLPRPGGGWVCVCGTYTGTGSAGTSRLAITLDAVDADGLPAGQADLRTLQSEIDPAQPAASDSFTVDARSVASADGRYAFVGWSERTATGWHAGVDVVDLVTLAVVDGLDLPDVDRSAVAQGRSWARSAPVVDTAPGTDTALITGDWFVEEPTGIAPSGADHWTVPFDGGKFVARTRSAGTRSADRCYEWERGVIDDSSFYVACIVDTNGTVRVERYGADGSAIDDTEVGRFTGFGLFAARPDHRLFLWDPQSLVLTVYDLQTGVTTSAKAPDTASSGPLDAIGAIGRAIGDWVAPSATAKILLEPALAISPDGETLYALGISGAFDSFGSAGIFAFDISGDTPTFKSHWEPTADFISLAVSEDGAFVYAAGMSGVDAQGNQAPAMQASVTVFDAADGSIRLIAGQLGAENASVFPDPIVR
jgi:hypothetical protein